MPVKIISDDKLALGVDHGVPKSFIHDLVTKFKDKTKKKKKNGNPQDPPADIGKDDAKSIWFSYAELEQLFYDNGVTPNSTANEKMKFGVRIYFGMHDKDHLFHRDPNGIPLPNPNGYDDQHTLVLVVTKKDNQSRNVDLLAEGVNTLSYGDEGLDIGKLCPPSCDGGETWS